MAALLANMAELSVFADWRCCHFTRHFLARQAGLRFLRCGLPHCCPPVFRVTAWPPLGGALGEHGRALSFAGWRCFQFTRHSLARQACLRFCSAACPVAVPRFPRHGCCRWRSGSSVAVGRFRPSCSSCSTLWGLANRHPVLTLRAGVLRHKRSLLALPRCGWSGFLQSQSSRWQPSWPSCWHGRCALLGPRPRGDIGVSPSLHEKNQVACNLILPACLPAPAGRFSGLGSLAAPSWPRCGPSLLGALAVG
jgi:hypothetical protein